VAVGHHRNNTSVVPGKPRARNSAIVAPTRDPYSAASVAGELSTTGLLQIAPSVRLKAEVRVPVRSLAWSCCERTMALCGTGKIRDRPRTGARLHRRPPRAKT